MKEKDLNWIHMQEVMAAIQNFLEQEEMEGGEEDWGEAYSMDMPAKRGTDVYDEDRPPQSLCMVQYFLAKHGKKLDKNYLRNMPDDLFIDC
ncbi:MAG: hypothetical protein ACLFUS_10765 [Candidatus Sumerlaeia bacterium]